MPEKLERLGQVTSASVLKCTGKNWDQWVGLLNKAGAEKMSHKEIVAYLKKKYKLSIWWQQGVTTGYEIAIGRKSVGYSESAGYSTVASKTFPLSNKEIWSLLLSPEGLSCWLKPFSDFDFQKGQQYEAEGGVYGEVRTLKKFVRVRMAWTEAEWVKPSILQIYIIPRTSKKAVLVFQHEKLPDGRMRIKMRDLWKKVLIDLADVVKD